MNILWVSSKSNHPGGGSTSERTLIRYLHRTEHMVERIAADDLPGLRLIRGPFEVRQIATGKLLERHLEARLRHGNMPDVIVSQGVYFPQAGVVARKFNIPHTTFIRDQFYRCPVARHNQCTDTCFNCVSPTQKMVWPLVRHLVDQKRKALDKIDLVLTNSQYMKEDLEQHTTAPIDVLYPPIEFPSGNGDGGTHDRIVYMGGGHWKGTKLVMELARRLPEYRFLVSGDPEVPTKWNPAHYPNVEYQPWVDRDLALSTARVHLAPSIWPEPFGRIPVEAGHHGVPTIASDRGGLPEAVGPGGILLDPDRINEWMRWITTMMDIDQDWKRHGREARNHSAKFNISIIGPKFVQQLEAMLWRSKNL